MTFRHFALAATALAFVAPAAFAQQPAAPAAPAQPSGPPPPAIPGICVFSQEVAVGTSVVGKYVAQRLEQINQQSGAELNAQKAALETEANTLQGQRATLGEPAFQTQAGALQQRADQFQALYQQRVQESQATETKALQRIGQDMTPLMYEVFKAHSCSIMIDRNSIFMTTPLMDLTSEVVTKLDAKLQQFPIERERLDQQQAGVPPPTQIPGAAGAVRPPQGPAAPARAGGAAPARSGAAPARGGR